MVAGANAIGFPSGPLIDPATGLPNAVGRAFFLALWNRTGQASGATNAVTPAQLASETAARQAEDTTLSNALGNEAVVRAAALAAEAANLAGASANLGGSVDRLFTALHNESVARVAGDAVVTLPSGLDWTSGAAAPTATKPIGSLYSREGGALGATLYVSRGAGAWAAVALV
jgi:hypothetical protein